MDKLKHFIQENKEAFNDEPLPAGHLERFERKLPTTRKPARKWLPLFAAAAAAAVAILVFIELRSGLADTAEQPSAYTCGETQQEFDELRLYYRMQMNDLFAQMRTVYKQEQVPGGIELLEETKRVIRNSQDFEENVLPGLPCSDAGLFAMNQYYSNSVESLQIMLKQMESGVGQADE